MAKFSIKDLNKDIAQYGVELVKGRGYFYFASLDDPCINEIHNPSSIYVYAFNHMSEAKWREHVTYELTAVGIIKKEEA